MNHYKKLSEILLAFVERFEGERSTEKLESFVKNFPEALITIAKEYLLNVESIGTLNSQMRHLIRMPLENTTLRLKDRLFFTLLIQISVAHLLDDAIKKDPDNTNYQCSELHALKITDFLDVDSITMALKLAAGEEVPRSQEMDIYDELKLYLSIMPVEMFIQNFIDQTRHKNFDLKHQAYMYTNVTFMSNHRSHLEYLLRNLVQDIWNSTLGPIDKSVVEKLITHIQGQFIAMKIPPIDVLSSALYSSAENSKDDSIKIIRLSSYGFSFDMPENMLNSMTPYYAAIGLDLHEGTITAIKARSNPSIESIYEKFNDPRINGEITVCPPYIIYNGDGRFNVDEIDPFNVNILKFMYVNHKDILLTYKPDLVSRMVNALSNMLFGELTFRGRDTLQKDLPTSIRDKSCVKFFDFLERILNDEDFINYDHAILDMLIIVYPNYNLLVGQMSYLDPNKDDRHVPVGYDSAELKDNVVLSNEKYLNQQCIEGKPKYINNYNKYTNSPFYKKVFDLLALYSPALNALRTHCSSTNHGLFGESKVLNDDNSDSNSLTSK
ncbi:MAG: hypothetical protein P8L77_05660 [Gammaproteobacteria bacterium]|nr:hypothetical protein [Gammaproteobacteria bacterium]